MPHSRRFDGSLEKWLAEIVDRATRNGRSSGVPKAVFWTSTIRGSRKALRRAGIEGGQGQDISFGGLGNDNVSGRVPSARGPLRASRPSCRARMIRLGLLLSVALSTNRCRTARGGALSFGGPPRSRGLSLDAGRPSGRIARGEGFPAGFVNDLVISSAIAFGRHVRKLIRGLSCVRHRVFARLVLCHRRAIT